jgi:oligopeptide/dipeptide ABC transporter ATP-binding protein
MIAIALAAGPELLLADEPTTALDVTLQAQILDLLAGLRAELGLGVLLITHDLAVVAEACDRAVVMYAGEVVEEGPVAALFAAPAHPYTRGLLASLPSRALGRSGAEGGPAARLAAIPGQPPAPGEVPAGCAFAPRCPEAFAACTRQRPDLYPAGEERTARCLLHAPGPEPGEGR